MVYEEDRLGGAEISAAVDSGTFCFSFTGNLGGGMKPAGPPDQPRATLWLLGGRGALLVCFWLLMGRVVQGLRFGRAMNDQRGGEKE